MQYYHSTIIQDTDFDQAITRVTEALKTEGFGVLTQIDIKETLKKKLDEDFRPYTILGACNPPYAFKALSAEDKIGTMLPCNVIVQQVDGGIEVAAIDPVASMLAVDNPGLKPIAEEIQDRLHRVIDSL
ncbi:MAG: DUF302 domain-containing protein [Bacteroidota bacterium]